MKLNLLEDKGELVPSSSHEPALVQLSSHRPVPGRPASHELAYASQLPISESRIQASISLQTVVLYMSLLIPSLSANTLFASLVSVSQRQPRASQPVIYHQTMPANHLPPDHASQSPATRPSSYLVTQPPNAISLRQLTCRS